jgi:threonine/homoserine/homoserine lactone efflux protein
MEHFFDFLVGKPVFLVIAVIISLAILFSFIKRIARLLLVVAAIAILYLAYLVWTGGNVGDFYKKVTSGEKTVKESVQKGAGALKMIDSVVKPASKPVHKPKD